METALTILGYLASAAVLAAFFMRSHLRLRQVALVSNALFVAYGLLAHVYPLLVLHACLGPLNLWRLREIRDTRRQIEEAVNRSDLSLEWLMPFMRRHAVPAETVLFRKNDPADVLYCIVDGTIALQETGIRVGPGALLGEIGIFAPDHARTQTAVATTDVRMLLITRDELLILYRRHPAFGIYLIQLITKRLIEDSGELERRLRAGTASA